MFLLQFSKGEAQSWFTRWTKRCRAEDERRCKLLLSQFENACSNMAELFPCFPLMSSPSKTDRPGFGPATSAETTIENFLNRSDSARRCRKSSTDAALQTCALFCTNGTTANCTYAPVKHASNLPESDFGSSHQFWVQAFQPLNHSN